MSIDQGLYLCPHCKRLQKIDSIELCCASASCPNCKREKSRADFERDQKVLFELMIEDFLSQNAALKSEIAVLNEVAEAAIKASAEIQAQKVIWPGEVDTLADALDKLKKHREGK